MGALLSTVDHKSTKRRRVEEPMLTLLCTSTGRSRSSTARRFTSYRSSTASASFS